MGSVVLGCWGEGMPVSGHERRAREMVVLVNMKDRELGHSRRGMTDVARRGEAAWGGAGR